MESLSPSPRLPSEHAPSVFGPTLLPAKHTRTAQPSLWSDLQTYDDHHGAEELYIRCSCQLYYPTSRPRAGKRINSVQSCEVLVGSAPSCSRRASRNSLTHHSANHAGGPLPSILLFSFLFALCVFCVGPWISHPHVTPLPFPPLRRKRASHANSTHHFANRAGGPTSDTCLCGWAWTSRRTALKKASVV